MRMRVFAAMLGLSVGGVLVPGCSTADHGAAVKTSSPVIPSGIIRSQGDLQRYLAASAGSASPLSVLTSGGRERFLSSATFNEKGITGFHYDDLQRELTATQIVAVLHLFGVERDVAIIPNVRVETAADRRAISAFVEGGDSIGDGSGGTDYKNYWCVSRATCNPSEKSICTSNC